MSGMYSVTPYSDPQLKPTLPSNMYSVTPIFPRSEGDSSSSSNNNNNVDSSLPASWQQLKKRQESILANLEKLEAKIQKFSKQNNYSLPEPKAAATSTTSTATASKTRANAPVASADEIKNYLREGEEALPVAQRTPHPSLARTIAHPVDLTIRSKPSNAPLITLAVAKLLKDSVTLRQFWHSSLGVSPQGYAAAQRTQQASAERDARITVIWANVETPVMVANAAMQTPVEGDANIARFVARTLSAALCPSSNLEQAALLDSWLDAVSGCDTAKEQKKLLKDANAHLGKNSYLCGNEVTLADLALWALVKSSGSAAPSNIKKLLDSLPSELSEIDSFVAAASV